jgi:hypothetical protein
MSKVKKNISKKENQAEIKSSLKKIKENVKKIRVLTKYIMDYEKFDNKKGGKIRKPGINNHPLTSVQYSTVVQSLPDNRLIF